MEPPAPSSLRSAGLAVHGASACGRVKTVGDVVELADVRERDRAAIEHALEDAEVWSHRIELARDAYGRALDMCQELGISPTVIARRVGKSEAAIRMHLKRRKKL